MRILEVDIKYPETFVRDKLVNFLRKFALSKIHSYNYVTMNQQVKMKYALSLDEIIKACFMRMCIEKSTKSERYIIWVNDVETYKDTNLSEALRFVDDGDLTTRGTNLFHDMRKYVEKKLPGLYNLYRITKGKKLWA